MSRYYPNKKLSMFTQIYIPNSIKRAINPYIISASPEIILPSAAGIFCKCFILTKQNDNAEYPKCASPTVIGIKKEAVSEKISVIPIVMSIASKLITNPIRIIVL